MAVRKKYRKGPGPPNYFQGGRVPEPEPAASGGAVDAAPAAEPAPVDDGGDALREAVAADRRAQELQQAAMRQAAEDPRTAIEREIDGLPVSDFKKQFLKRYPMLASDPALSRAAGWHHNLAIQEGVPDDSDAMAARILDGITSGIASQQREPPKPAPAPIPAPAAAPLLEPRRSMPMSAPVSRTIASGTSGKREPAGGDMTLTAAEREIARNSFGAPDMSDSQKEFLYLQNRNRYRKMKADGSYSDQGGG